MATRYALTAPSFLQCLRLERVLADGAGYLFNTGKIMGSTIGIVYADTFNPSDVTTTVNTGTIAGGLNPQIRTGPNYFAYDAVRNLGTDGDVRLGRHAGSNLVKVGTLGGSVYLGSGGQAAKSTCGTVSDLMVGGIGGDTILGGKTGGSLANPVYPAPCFASMADPGDRIVPSRSTPE